jgi:hypothetical protein
VATILIVVLIVYLIKRKTDIFRSLLFFISFLEIALVIYNSYLIAAG